MLYTYTDRLGSITHITDNEGKLIAEISYDAWGRLRDPETWQYTINNIQLSIINYRGYTGHEHLTHFGIINMNGRLYDPVLGRFLSPDNYVQAPDFTQNFNRYSYVLNNPLKYTDPDGEFINLIIGGIIGGFMGYMAGDMAGATGWKLVGYIGVGVVAGALTSGVSAGVSSALGGGAFGAGFIGSSTAATATTSFYTGSVIGASAGFTGGFVTGMGNGLLEGQSLGQSSVQGLKYGGIGAVSGFVLGGIAGGINAVKDGRNFWHGGKLEVDISNPITKIKQNTMYDCTYASAESNDTFIGGNKSQSYYKNENPGKSGGRGLTDKEVYEMYKKEGYNILSMPTNDPKNYIAGQMQEGRAVSLSYNTNITIDGQKFAHNVAVKRIKLYDNGKFIIRIMDPAKGYFRRLTAAEYSNIRLLLSIW